jgi:hypothetical protein
LLPQPLEVNRVKWISACCAFVAVISTSLAVEPFREFRSSKGQVINARLVGVQDDKAAIQMADGKTHVISIFILSLPDQLYVRGAADRGDLTPKSPAPGANPVNPTTQPVVPVATGPATIDFAKHVLPIFTERCTECHKAPYEKNTRIIKPKAGLRLDSFEATMKGSTDGQILKPGKPEDSVLYELISLEEDDSDIMPPKGDPLTAAQIETIRKWIAEGARSSVNAVAPSGPVAPSPDTPTSKSSPLDQLAANIRPLRAEILDIAAKNGAMVNPLAEKHPLLRIEFISIASSVTDSELGRLLPPVRNNVTQLDLSRTKISDKAIMAVGKCSNLTYLNLSHTEAGNEALAGLRNLKNLWYLNLLHTKVTDRGLSTLAEIKSLQEIYLWQSDVTASGVQELRAALPKAKIIF